MVRHNMKIHITMKNPDCVYDAVQQAAKDSADEVNGITTAERAELVESRREEIEEAIKQWVKYGEYITVELDTVLRTARVCDA